MVLNRTMYAIRKSADRAAETNARTRSGTSPLGRATKGSSATKTPPKKTKLNDDELAGYLDRVIDRYVSDARLSVENRAIEDSMYLNRFNRMIANDAPAQELGGTLPGAREERKSPELVERELQERAEFSPERLRDKYDGDSPSKSRRSPSKNKLSGGPGDLTTMMKDAEVRRYVNEYRNQIEYLKLVIFALDLKLRDHENLKTNIELTRLELEKSEECRKLLQQSISETTQELKQENENLRRFQQNLSNERNTSQEKVRELSRVLDETASKLEKTEAEKRKLELELSEMLMKMRLLNELKQQVDYHKQELKLSEKRRTELQEEIFLRTREFNKALDDITEQNGRLIQENKTLQGEILELKTHLTRERINGQEKNNELEHARKSILALEAKTAILADVQTQRDSLINQLAQAQLEAVNFETIISEWKADTLNRTKEVENNARKYQDQAQIYAKKNAALEDKVNSLQEQMNGLVLQNSDLKSNISTLEQLLVVKDDVNNQLENANANLMHAYKEKEGLRQQLDMGAEYIISQDEKNYELQKLIIYLKGVITEKDDYVLNLKKLIIEMKEKSAIYVPVREDPIDKRLADYLNNCNDPNKLRVLFIRESEGVYMFGSKRIYVKVEMDKIMIRVGGGFLSIEEFLDQYVPVELERLARNDPVKILTNNLAVHKTVSGRTVNEIERPKTTQATYKTFSPVIQKAK
eukprot:TRINITY_DN11677_c0_g2_i2.p1 TRINITY_DN11677_c0_g2~~TRINITY_DN11677_c0_g2_i2.p1  ORF type:complete len:700 (-),score=314.98 TRINITY_DN11677_c0_g2_i2:138-2237(-)